LDEGRYLFGRGIVLRSPSPYRALYPHLKSSGIRLGDPSRSRQARCGPADLHLPICSTEKFLSNHDLLNIERNSRAIEPESPRF
jgi:hypothetical protein